ncbi:MULTISPECIES: thiolase family protein [unclassified Pseudofrankia]|uniref:thiolase family protein n=1 Tax=unclassified Pseudofrankia TaxID=2994372 RepID=UPI0008DAA4F5|nr:MULTISPECIES: thiolase family protein [unclassified Pseudofrankia]MDT3446147.1 thiolase family protein [Pseudofrankia sp. BMG5.37]OHV62275.1 acetyl-CoA acetyltransferase [Pseudofrankia sp. BMG5.36]
MTEAVIVSTARTAIGRARKGTLVGLDAFALAEAVVPAALERSGIPAADLDDLILAESYQGGGVIARHTAVRLGLTGVSGAATNRHCAGGLTAVAIGAGSIRAGMDRVVIAGGTESLSNQVLGSKRDAEGNQKIWMSPPNPDTPEAPAFDMSITVGENTAREMGLTRRDVDEWTVYTQERAIASIDSGAFVDEIIPLDVTRPDGTTVRFDTDEHPRRGTTLERLATLPVLHPELPDATVTAANAAGLNDAAAAVTLTSDTYAAAHGLTPLARIRAWATAGIEPALTGLAPTLAIPKALDRAGLALADIDLFEINEAFCSVPVAAVRKLGINPEIVNVNGSGASLGHPISATGARMVVTMVGELRRRGATLGCVSMCAGGGMAAAMIIEIV